MKPHRWICNSFTPLLLCALSSGSALGLTSDDFNRSNLDTTRWSFVNPLSDGSIALDGAGTSDAHLSVVVPGGVSHEPWQTNRSVRVMQTASDVDFEVEVGFVSEPTLRYQMQGVLVEQDEDNWIRVEIHHDGTGLRVFAASTVNGTSSSELSVPILAGSAKQLRLARTNDSWAVRIAGDDEIFVDVGGFVHDLSVSAIGLFGANHGGADPPAYTAVFDYFFDTAAPVDPEDGSEEPDTLSPLIHNLRYEMSPSGELLVSWNTDEPSEGTVSYGTTTDYELGVIDESGFTWAHAVSIPGLTPQSTYHFQVCAEDVGGRESCLEDVELFFDPQGPTISVWYGMEQSFGTNGAPQPWANILGHVEDMAGVASLSYELNGGTAVPLSVGPDGRRLQNDGDFNADLSTFDLLSGTNLVVFRAMDNLGNESSKVVTVDYSDTGALWPLPYSVGWGQLSSNDEIQDVAQVVDGKWGLEASTVRTLEPGYDRLIAVGDSTWTDVEFLVPITLHDTPSGFGVGVLLRWNGHTDEPVVCGQPKCGYFPLGAILWIRNNRLEIFGNDGIIYDSKPMTPTAGVVYWLRGRVETEANGSLYFARVWEDGTEEPGEWDVTGQADIDDPIRGSLLLLSHQADASFGTLSVAESDPDNLPPTALDDIAWVTPSGSAEVAVLENDFDIDGGIDPTSVVIVDEPDHGSAEVHPITGWITYTPDGASASRDTLSYVVDDDEGATSNEAFLDLLISPELPPAAISDDFNRCVLSPGWQFVDPLEDGAFSLVGTGTGDAHLALTLPEGTRHDAWAGGGLNETVRIMQPALNLELEIVAKWHAEPAGGSNDQGIVVEQDPSNWIRFDVYHNDEELRLFVGKTISGNNTTLYNLQVPTGSATHLRVRREGDTWTTSTSPDGTAWTERHSFEQYLQVREAGVFAGNPVAGLGFTSEIDYFLVAADPLIAEDAAVNSVTVITEGAGTVQLSPDQPTYACGETVELLATPAPGWTFLGWSGDLEGDENPSSLTITGEAVVTATFGDVSSAPTEGAGSDDRVLSATPNPFSSLTSIRFQLSEPSQVVLSVSDAAGRRVRSLTTGGTLPAGTHSLSWDGRNERGDSVPTGVYFLRLRTERSNGVFRILRLE